jgi:hypothetical protein
MPSVAGNPCCRRSNTYQQQRSANIRWKIHIKSREQPGCCLGALLMSVVTTSSDISVPYTKTLHIDNPVRDKNYFK